MNVLKGFSHHLTERYPKDISIYIPFTIKTNFSLTKLKNNSLKMNFILLGMISKTIYKRFALSKMKTILQEAASTDNCKTGIFHNSKYYESKVISFISDSYSFHISLPVCDF